MYKPSKEHRELQLKCLEILDVIHDICIKNNIEYSLCGGSVIGAHLYQGFIPWDDDIDLMMTRENYNKFLKVCKKELIKPYKLMHYTTTKDIGIGFAKIIDENTTLVEPAVSKDYHVSGVFVDITVYDCVPMAFLKIFQRLSSFAYILLVGRKPQNFKSRICYIASRCTPFFIKKMVMKICDTIFSYFKNNEEDICYEFWGMSALDCGFPNYFFNKYTNINFEGKSYRIIENFMQYLKIRYKRDDFYLPEDQQKPHHIIHFDLKKPYKEYLKERQ